MGFEEYEPLAARYRVPIVVTGFEPVDILEGIYLCVRQLERGVARVENQYRRAVRREGNRPAQKMINEVFEVVSRHWRGIGELPGSGLAIRESFATYDAERRFGAVRGGDEHAGECVSGAVLRGQCKPPDCPAFGTRCTPQHPLGVTMVSAEGACAAYYRFRGAQGSG
jgi:hydrogenase expression/formation protein HypD